MISAWLVHLYTASSAVLGFLSISLVVRDRYREAFAWLAISTIVDATDGILARRVDVASRIPWFNGGRLDDIVDYLTYVFVPAVIVWHAGLVPDAWRTPIASAMLLSSAYGFAREDAKTQDHFFTGFPSYWNIVVFYLYAGGLAVSVNAAILIALAIFVFVPIRYVYPSRTPVLRPLTLTLGIVWGVLLLLMLWQMPSISAAVFWSSLVFPGYYVVLSFWLEVTRRRHPGIDDR